jgi:uncharacterized membrane protein
MNRPSSFVRNGILLGSGLVTLVILVLLPPFVSIAVADGLMAAFDPVCHQLFDRSPHVDGTPFAVCHRCFGAYVGLAAGSIIFTTSSGRSLPSWSPFLLLVLAAIPGVIDWGGEFLGFWTNTPNSRLITGGWFGFWTGMLLGSAVQGERFVSG